MYKSGYIKQGWKTHPRSQKIPKKGMRWYEGHRHHQEVKTWLSFVGQAVKQVALPLEFT